jgi:hypothetical protein
LHTADVRIKIPKYIEGTNEINHSIKMFESTFFQNSRVHIIFEMAVVKRYAYAIEAKACKELRVVFSKEVFEEFIKEELLLLLSEDFQHGCAVLAFVPRVACDEVLHALIVSALVAKDQREVLTSSILPAQPLGV